MKESFAQLAQNITSLDNKFLRVQELETKVVNFDNLVKDIEEKMDTMKTTVESEVQLIREQIKSFSSSLQGIETSQQSYVEELTNLKNQSTQFIELSSVLPKYETLNANLDTIKNTLTETTSQFVSQNNFEIWKKQLEIQLDDSVKTVEDLRSEMEAMKTTVESEVQLIREQIKIFPAHSRE